MFRLIVICILCLSVAVVDAQALKPTAYYMGLPTVSQAAKDYHAGTVPAGDNDRTYSIADSMSTLNNDTRPFYIFLVSKMLLTANRQLSIGLGRTCRDFLQRNPDAVVGLLFSTSVKPAYKYQWARVIALDIMTACPGDKMKCMKTSRLLALQHCREQNEEGLETIYSAVRASIRNAGR
ncbi:MAG: hypothetical protein BGO70_02455 [Bacteroidetes bacterium 43-93]|nr:hypothetical protein [Bacteroidota bacterium]OJW99158.1 MAG: hypothetical protein BGO70_02455 [Bacteroidetes bacterium 43-93]